MSPSTCSAAVTASMRSSRFIRARSANFRPWRAFTAQLENALETRKTTAVLDGRRVGHPGRDLFPRPRGGETRQSVDPDLWIGGRRGNRSFDRRSTGEPVWVQGRAGRAQCDLADPPRAGRHRLPFRAADFRTGSSIGSEAAGSLGPVPGATASLSRRRPDRGAAAKAGIRGRARTRARPAYCDGRGFRFRYPGSGAGRRRVPGSSTRPRARGCWLWRPSLPALVCARS